MASSWHLSMDAILIANECVDVRKITKAHGILCKLDKRAYDHLNWEFLWRTLEKGFGIDGLIGQSSVVRQ